MFAARALSLILCLSLPAVSMAQNCSPYAVNQYRVFSGETISGLLGGSTIGYAVQKTADHRYKLFFDIEFWGPHAQKALQNNSSSSSQYLSELLVESENEEKKLREQTRSCFKQFNQIRFGDGQTSLEFHLIETGQPGPLPKRIRVNIAGDGGHRSNSREYSSNISCGTIIHEVLHLTGLDDEYKETHLSLGFWGLKAHQQPIENAAYNCRALSDSFMSNHTAYYLNDRDQLSQRYSQNSPLRAAHVREILFPGCSGNVIYRQCIKNAYETSKEHGGKGCTPSPEVCGNYNKWLQ